MLIDKAVLSHMLRTTARIWRENTGPLSGIDSRFGDGDHGVTIGKIAGLIDARVEDWGEESLRDFIDNLGAGIMAIGGGSAGPLYGTLVGGLAEPLAEEQALDASMLKCMLAASRDSMFEITKARIGDKTMMDALLPAVEAAQAAPDDIAAVLTTLSSAAWEGAKATEGQISKFGRARSYGERTIGTPDAGAQSTALLFQGLWEGYREATT